jgi:hypothetical protein
VTGPVFSVVGYDGAATTESAEPAGDGDNTIWYLWTAPANLNVTLSTAASSAGTILSAYQVGGSGAPAYNAFIPIASNGSGGYSATVSFPVTANTTYAFAVGTYATAPGNGSVILSMASVPLGLAGPVFRSPPPVGGTPANDDFANAQVIRDADFYVMTYNASATTEAGEHPATGLHTVWYSWTPQASGVTIIHTVFATYAHQLSVFTGTGIATAVQIVPTQYGNAGSSGVLDSAGFMAAAHTTYHIAVGCQYSDLANAQLIMGLTGPGKNVFTNAGRFAGFLDPGQDSFIKMLIGSGGSVTGEAVIDGQVMKLGGAFNISGDYSKTISGTIFQFYLDPTGLSTTMTGSVTTGSATYPVSLDLTAYGGAVPPPPPRRYTVLIAPDPNAGPAGYGAGTLSVLTQGGVTFAGRLADGTSFSTGGWIANSGTWDLFLPLYSNTGRLTGQVSFHPVQGVSDFSANITWVKPTSPKGGPGFIAASTMAGSLYTAQRPALSPAGPETASFSAGGLASAAEYPGLLQVGGAAKGNGITLDFNKSTGVITGSFLPPGATKKINLYGVAFQDQDMAAGYFLGPDAPGCFLLED